MENCNEMPPQAKGCVPDWAWGLPCAITVTDASRNIIYMNRASREINAKGRDIMGRDLHECHSPRSNEIIDRLMKGGENIYTIEKHGRHKLIFQSAWYTSDGKVGGLVEISIITPENMPHYVRS